MPVVMGRVTRQTHQKQDIAGPQRVAGQAPIRPVWHRARLKGPTHRVKHIA